MNWPVKKYIYVYTMEANLTEETLEGENGGENSRVAHCPCPVKYTSLNIT
jgi:hypothetical protein